MRGFYDDFANDSGMGVPMWQVRINQGGTLDHLPRTEHGRRNTASRSSMEAEAPISRFRTSIPTATCSSPVRFITDLVPVILESDDHWWPRDLVRLALVSVAWLGPIRRRLYACPSVRSFKACRRLARSLQENPSLLALVRGLELRPVGEHSTSPLSAQEMAGLRYLLGLEGIQILTLGGELAVHAERFLHMLGHAEVIVDLRIEGSDVGCSYLQQSKRASLEWDEAIAFKFAGLRKLKLSNLELDIAFVPSSPYELCVTDLICDDVYIISGYFHSLLNRSWSSLRHLSVTTSSAADFNAHMYSMLCYCAPTLESLRYQALHESHSEMYIFQHSPKAYPSLRLLHLADVMVDYETLSVIGQCCVNLEELSIVGRRIRITVDEWAAFMQTAPPSLRRVVVY